VAVDLADHMEVFGGNRETGLEEIGARAFLQADFGTIGRNHLYDWAF